MMAYYSCAMGFYSNTSFVDGSIRLGLRCTKKKRYDTNNKHIAHRWDAAQGEETREARSDVHCLMRHGPGNDAIKFFFKLSYWRELTINSYKIHIDD